MNEFNKKRLELISKNIDNVIEKAVIESGKKLEPLKENIDKALEVVEKFIIDNSRIIYGGLAQNELIKIKSKKDAFYKDNNLEIPDYDIYSPEPIKDLIYLANTLYDMGFRQVSFSEAVHLNTYTLRLNKVTGAILDIHYVWNPHYKTIPKQKIGKFYYASPEFIFIDLYKIYTDPLVSFKLRIEKVFKRTSLLEKYYPVTKPNHFNKEIYTNISADNKKLINKIIKDYLSNNTDVIISGLFCYNFYMQQVDVKNTVNINYLSIISDNIYKVADQIYNYLIKNSIKDDIKIDKYHPFFEVFDTIIHIKYKGQVLLEIIGNMERCIPYVSTKTKDNISLQFLSYHGLLLQFYSYLFLFRYKKDYKKVEFIKNLIYYLQQSRLQYLYKNKLTGLENSVFAELIIKCKFKTQDERVKSEERIEQNIRKGKAPFFTYRPSKKRITHTNAPKFVFPNTSGNLIG